MKNSTASGPLAAEANQLRRYADHLPDLASYGSRRARPGSGLADPRPIAMRAMLEGFALGVIPDRDALVRANQLPLLQRVEDVSRHTQKAFDQAWSKLDKGLDACGVRSGLVSSLILRAGELASARIVKKPRQRNGRNERKVKRYIDRNGYPGTDRAVHDALGGNWSSIQNVLKKNPELRDIKPRGSKLRASQSLPQTGMEGGEWARSSEPDPSEISEGSFETYLESLRDLRKNEPTAFQELRNKIPFTPDADPEYVRAVAQVASEKIRGPARR